MKTTQDAAHSERPPRDDAPGDVAVSDAARVPRGATPIHSASPRRQHLPSLRRLVTPTAPSRHRSAPARLLVSAERPSAPRAPATTAACDASGAVLALLTTARESGEAIAHVARVHKLKVNMFAFKQNSSPTADNREACDDLLRALVEDRTSHVLAVSEIEKAPMEYLCKWLREYGFVVHCVKMDEASSSAGRGCNLIAWRTDVLELVDERGGLTTLDFCCVENGVRKTFRFPCVQLRDVASGRRFKVVAVHLTPQTLHRELLQWMEGVAFDKDALFVGDMNLQYAHRRREWDNLVAKPYHWARNVRTTAFEPDALAAYVPNQRPSAMRVRVRDPFAFTVKDYPHLMAKTDHPQPLRLSVTWAPASEVPAAALDATDVHPAAQPTDDAPVGAALPHRRSSQQPAAQRAAPAGGAPPPDVVFATRTGKRLHRRQGCYGASKAMTNAEAVSRGLTPCKICAAPN